MIKLSKKMRYRLEIWMASGVTRITVNPPSEKGRQTIWTYYGERRDAMVSGPAQSIELLVEAVAAAGIPVERALTSEIRTIELAQGATETEREFTARISGIMHAEKAIKIHFSEGCLCLACSDYALYSGSVTITIGSPGEVLECYNCRLWEREDAREARS